MILCASFNLPFRFIDEGIYNVPYTWGSAKSFTKVHIKLEQSFSKSEQIAGFKIEKSEGSKVDTTVDEHGIINHTKVLVEFEDNKSSLNKVDKYDLIQQMHIPLKIASQQVLNRLGQTVRVTTNNFWIRSINMRDMFDFRLYDKDSRISMITFDPGHVYYFPRLVVYEQSKVKAEIEEALRVDLQIPAWKDLYLDAINYFTIGRFNESVIIMNIALESFVAEHLYQKLITHPELIRKKQNAKDEVLNIFGDKFHKVMEKSFEIVDGRSFKEQQDLWTKFNDVRNTRKLAIHSFTKRISGEEAKKVLDYIIEVINWIQVRK
jgi:hypothetical protein